MPMKAAAKSMAVSSSWVRERRTMRPVSARAMIRSVRAIPARWDRDTPYTPETERVSPPPRQPPIPPRHTLDLTALVATALEGIAPSNRTCEEDILFDDAVRTPCPPGTEDDVVMESPGDLDDLEAAKCFLDEDNAL